jgi:hypothetical protein
MGDVLKAGTPKARDTGLDVTVRLKVTLGHCKYGAVSHVEQRDAVQPNRSGRRETRTGRLWLGSGVKAQGSIPG